MMLLLHEKFCAFCLNKFLKYSRISGKKSIVRTQNLLSAFLRKLFQGSEYQGSGF